MVMMKEGEQARKVYEKLGSGAREQCSALDMVMLKEGERARELNEWQGCGAREQQASHCAAGYCSCLNQVTTFGL